MTRACKLALVAAALAAVAAALLAPALSGAQSENDLRNRAGQARARERGLAGDVARLGALVPNLDGDTSLIKRRCGYLRPQSAAGRVGLATLGEHLGGERRRV